MMLTHPHPVLASIVVAAMATAVPTFVELALQAIAALATALSLAIVAIGLTAHRAWQHEPASQARKRRRWGQTTAERAAGQALPPPLTPPQPRELAPELEIAVPQPPPPPSEELVAHLAQRGAAAWEFFLDNGFVVLDLGLDAEGITIFADVAREMAAMAMDPEIKHNRGPGRTCVNSTANIRNTVWKKAVKIIMQNDTARVVMCELVKRFKIQFHDCGGDYIEGGSPDTDDGEFRNPCRWHRDYPFYMQWFCISVLAEPTDISQGPLWMESWNTGKGRVPFVGNPGLCIIRDVYALHRGSSHNTRTPRAMPSFRFCAASAATSSSCLSVPQLLEFIG